MRKHNINITSAEEHVPEIERCIRTLKERCRAQWSRLPFKECMPKIIVIGLVKNCVTWINSFPSAGGISSIYSPRTIMTGIKMDYNKNCKIAFGEYAQVYNTTKNDMTERTVGGICLGPANNIQGGYQFMKLATGKVITKYKFYKVPMTNEVVERVIEIGRKQKAAEGLQFGDEYTENDEITGVNENEVPELEEEDYDEDFDNINIDMRHSNEDEIVLDYEEYEEASETETEVEEEEEEEANDDDLYTMINEIEDEFAGAVEDLDDLIEDMNNENAQITRYGREIIRPTEYEPSFTGQRYEQTHIMMAIEYVLQQYSLAKGLEKFGKKGEDAAIEELRQQHLRDSFKPMIPSGIPEEKKKEILDSIMLLTEKDDGVIKGRNCANGSVQRKYISKEDTASPTAKLESILLTAVIEAKEDRDTRTVDIPNAFMQTRVEDDKDKVIIRMRGRLAEYMERIAPEIYSPYVVLQKGKKVLYCEAQNAIYGTLKAALLFYKKLRKDLEDMGFIFNRYDPCVANKYIKGVQQTVVFHVDDLKVSCCIAEENDKFIKQLKEIYEVEGLKGLKAVSGKRHKFLGMTLDYEKIGQVVIDMKDYVKEMIKDFGEYLNDGEVKTPAANWLFDVCENVEKLSNEKKEEFHTMVAKALFLCKRGRPDIMTSVAFLSTRVREPDNDDWKKLLRMMQYLKSTRDLVLTLSADNTNILKWYVDASYAVHPNMRSHTGSVLTMGKGAIQAKSVKQKINTKSSTEAELIASDDVMPDLLWVSYFLEEQGYGSYKSIMMRDNKSCMLLEKNGQMSSSRRTKPINVRYYFITDRIEKGDLKIEYCPTDDMVADYMTKPLQGDKFRKFRKEILNL